MSKNYLDVLTREERRLLEKHHFDEESFERLRARYRRGDWTSESNRLRGQVEHPREGDIKRLPEKIRKRVGAWRRWDGRRWSVEKWGRWC